MSTEDLIFYISANLAKIIAFTHIVLIVCAYAVLAEAILSFLGVGPEPPTPTWGNIIAEGRTYIREASWITLFPGLAIAITVLGLNLLGDGLRDALDPRMRVQQGSE